MKTPTKRVLFLPTIMHVTVTMETQHTNNDCSESVYYDNTTMEFTCSRYDKCESETLLGKFIWYNDTHTNVWGKVFRIFIYSRIMQVFLLYFSCCMKRLKYDDDDKRKSAQLLFCVVIRVCKATLVAF